MGLIPLVNTTKAAHREWFVHFVSSLSMYVSERGHFNFNQRVFYNFVLSFFVKKLTIVKIQWYNSACKETDRSVLNCICLSRSISKPGDNISPNGLFSAFLGSNTGTEDTCEGKGFYNHFARKMNFSMRSSLKHGDFMEGEHSVDRNLIEAVQH
jgi:hypothetical protein